MSAVLSAAETGVPFDVTARTPAEVGAALRRARIALALPIESIARELRLPAAQMRAIEAGLPGPFDDLAQRTDATRRALRRLSLPPAWAAFQPDAGGLLPSPAAAVRGAVAANRAPAAAARPVPALATPPATSRLRRIGAVTAATAILGAALVASLMPAEEASLEDMPRHARSSEPEAPVAEAAPVTPGDTALAQAMPGAMRAAQDTATVAPPAGAATATQAAASAPESPAAFAGNPPAPDTERAGAVQGASTVAAAPGTAARNAVAAKVPPVYAVLPGSVVTLPERPVIEVIARADTVIELLTEHGASNFALHAGDRIVLSTGRADRLVVADRDAVEVRVGGRAAALEPIAGQSAGRWNGPAR